MNALLRDFWRDDAGLIVSAEIVIILTIGVIGMVTGLVCLQHALLSEFADLGLAFQSLNQSYSTPWYRGCMKWWGWGGRTSWVAGSCFIDVFDGCVGSGPGGCYNADICGTGNYQPAATGQVNAELQTTTETTTTTTPSSTNCLPQTAPTNCLPQSAPQKLTAPLQSPVPTPVP